MDKLPNEIIINITYNLNYCDCMKLLSVCKKFSFLKNIKSIWSNYINNIKIMRYSDITIKDYDELIATYNNLSYYDAFNLLLKRAWSTRQRCITIFKSEGILCNKITKNGKIHCEECINHMYSYNEDVYANYNFPRSNTILNNTELKLDNTIINKLNSYIYGLSICYPRKNMIEIPKLDHRDVLPIKYQFYPDNEIDNKYLNFDIQIHNYNIDPYGDEGYYNFGDAVYIYDEKLMDTAMLSLTPYLNNYGQLFFYNNKYGFLLEFIDCLIVIGYMESIYSGIVKPLNAEHLNIIKKLHLPWSLNF